MAAEDMDDRGWMYLENRTCDEYLKGVNVFIEAAVDDMKQMKKNVMYCPCLDCKNKKRYSHQMHLHAHLIMRGFKKKYKIWNKHGEEGLNPGEPHDDGSGDEVPSNMDGSGDHVPSNTHEGDQHISDDEILAMDDDYNDMVDDINQMVHEAEANNEDQYTEGEFAKYQALVRDSKKPLYPGTSMTLLESVLKLLKLKAIHGWSDRSFSALLDLLRGMLPKENVLPINTYEAKKIICPLGLEVEKIHACKENCMLFRGDYKELTHCIFCGTSRYKRRKDGGDGEVPSKRNGAPQKVVWYFPIIPRLKRMFANSKEAELLTWHGRKDDGKGRKNDANYRHPADGADWKNIDARYGDFAEEVRNIRFALSTDGMNPFGEMSVVHSTWPVVLCIYNLPPWLCHKRKYLMLTVLISGRKQPGIDIDVYLRPLIDDLKLLWSDGVEVWDQFRRQYFMMHAMLLCTIQDLPALYSVSGQTKAGGKGCPQCLYETESVWLKHSKKPVYMRHRRFLSKSHPYRKMKAQFDGKVEKGSAARHFTGEDILHDQQKLGSSSALGKRKRNGEKPLWKKLSIFFELPYWKYLAVRHCIDLMHIKKNVCDSLMCTFLNMKGKSKDHKNGRADLKEMGIRPELVGQGDDHDLPPSCITLSKKEKKELCEFLKSVKVPSGYSANIGDKVSVPELKLVGKMKSHTCHILLSGLLAAAIRNILPMNVRVAIMNFCFFFNAIDQKVIDKFSLEDLQKNLIKTVCHLEMFFPPSFFDMMVHLTTHLVKEIHYLGPVYLHQMFPYERYLGILKSYVRNRSLPEGSIVQGYSTEEVLEWCANYIDPENPIGIPQPSDVQKMAGKGTLGKKAVTPEHEAFERAHFLVLQQMTEVSSYIDEHKEILRRDNPERTESWLAKEHMKKFNIWFRDRINAISKKSDLLRKLAEGPIFTVVTYQGYEINGYTFYTIAQDRKSIYQNSGVRVDAYDSDMQKSAYYGQIEEIWELNYVTFKVPLFKCHWVQGTSGVQKDQYGFTTVDLNHLGYKTEPFVLAKQVEQVFYVTDTVRRKRHVVLPGKKRIVGVEGAIDEDEYNQFDEVPPFSSSIMPQVSANEPTPYLRTDHAEGIRVPRCPKKQRGGKKQ